MVKFLGNHHVDKFQLEVAQKVLSSAIIGEDSVQDCDKLQLNIWQHGDETEVAVYQGYHHLR